MNKDLEIYEKQGLGNSLGFGKSPALAIIDFVNGFNDPNIFGGGNIPSAIKMTKELLDICRNKKIPIAFTRIIYNENENDIGVFAKKAPKLKTLTLSNPLSHIVSELEPIKGEQIIDKTDASAFHSTGLLRWLINNTVDTLIIAGCTTSGCVRATAVDACAYNFIPIIVSDCVGDRAIGPHNSSLFDLEQKYSDVVSLNNIKEYLSNIEN
ncbi:MAG: Maleamate amidohydrolase [Alphaproteobacteria bacterium MarineAlpha2_Bin1]|nr:MAG: Maleamate amidohydrolase [Alphaproteobacteria bacterium MarineAlpha2_Bin1]